MYNELGLQINRGTFNSQISGGVSRSVMHSYKNTSDTLATISAPGYFPNNFNVDTSEIIVGDALQIVGSDGLEIFEITSLSPVTLIANSGNFPSGITTTTINATAITTQTLNATTSITTPQYFGVNMDLTGDINCANLTANAGTITAASEVFAPLLRTTPVTGQITSPNITATFIGTNTLDANTYVNTIGTMTAQGNITSASGNIAATVGNVTAGGSMTSAGNITSTSGVISGTMVTPSIDIGSGSLPITFFDEFSATVSVSGPWAAPKNTFMKIQRINQMLYYYIRGIPAAPATIADAMFIADGTVPAAFRPSILRDVGPCIAINNSAFQTSAVAIRSTGGIVISGTLQNSGPFVGAGDAGFYDIYVVISQN